MQLRTKRRSNSCSSDEMMIEDSKSIEDPREDPHAQVPETEESIVQHQDEHASDQVQGNPSTSSLVPTIQPLNGNVNEALMSANPKPSIPFDYYSFYDSHLVVNSKFNSDSFKPDDYKIVEFGLGSKDVSQMYSMTTQLGSLPVMKVSGEISVCNLTPELVHNSRIAERPLRMDKYLLRLSLSSKDYQACVSNAMKTTDLWQSQKEKLFDICRAAKLYFKKGQFQKQGVDIVFHGLMGPNEFVFAKNVASMRAVDAEHPLRSLLPTQVEQNFMRKPSSFHWNPKIPIFDELYKPVELTETPVKDEQADVFFQVNQLFYGGKLGLNPEICGVKVTMSEVFESPKKKARRSALF